MIYLNAGTRGKSFFFAMAAAGAVLFLSGSNITAQQVRTEHGGLDTYSADGISLAWAILKAEAGQNPEKDLILLRIVLQNGKIPAVTVIGIDPFSGERKSLPAAPGPGQSVEVRLPRSHFADYPRTEILFTESARTIYYVGIPDTTPEFLGREKMETHLTERLSRGSR
jgi:hypothetical protein